MSLRAGMKGEGMLGELRNWQLHKYRVINSLCAPDDYNTESYK
jgi:hypothetical protein